MALNTCSRCGVRPAEARAQICARCLLMLGDIDAAESLLVDAEESPPCELLSIIGETPRAITFLGEQRWPVRRLVALKVLKVDACPPGAVARALRGVPAHPSIAPILESGHIGGRPYLMTPFLGGGPITQRYAHADTTLATRVQAVRSVMDALVFAHAHAVAHGQLVASNLLCAAHAPFAVHIVDFECNARKVEGDVRIETLVREDLEAMLLLGAVLRVDVERLRAEM